MDKSKEVELGLTFLIGKDGAHIELHDKVSGICMFRGDMTPENTLSLMGRLSHTPVKGYLGNLSHVGKKLVMDKLEFELPEDADYSTEKEMARTLAKAICPVGWTPDMYFGSQNSFFTKDGKRYARTIIRSYVDPDENDLTNSDSLE